MDWVSSDRLVKHNAKYARDYWAVTVNPSWLGGSLRRLVSVLRRRAQVEKCFKMSPRDPQFENIPHLAGLLRDLRDDCGGDRAFDVSQVISSGQK